MKIVALFRIFVYRHIAVDLVDEFGELVTWPSSRDLVGGDSLRPEIVTVRPPRPGASGDDPTARAIRWPSVPEGGGGALQALGQAAPRTAALVVGHGWNQRPPPVSYHVRYRQNNAAYVRAVAADRAAAGPFEAFLVRGQCVEAKRIFDFWCDAQVGSNYIFTPAAAATRNNTGNLA